MVMGMAFPQIASSLGVSYRLTISLASSCFLGSSSGTRAQNARRARSVASQILCLEFCQKSKNFQSEGRKRDFLTANVLELLLFGFFVISEKKDEMSVVQCLYLDKR